MGPGNKVGPANNCEIPQPSGSRGSIRLVKLVSTISACVYEFVMCCASLEVFRSPLLFVEGRFGQPVVHFGERWVAMWVALSCLGAYIIF